MAEAVGESPFKLWFFRTTKDYLLGIALLFVVVILWTSSSFVTQGLFVNGYHKPFLITYLNTSSFALYLVPSAVRYLWKKLGDVDAERYEEILVTINDTYTITRDQYEVLPASEHDTIENPAHHSTHGRYAPAVIRDTVIEPAQEAIPLAPLTTKETARLALIFCIFWFIANWSLNASLEYTSVASSTILSSTSSFFTLAIGRLFAVEFLTLTKAAAVTIRFVFVVGINVLNLCGTSLVATASFIGVLLVSLSDQTSLRQTPVTPVSISSSLPGSPSSAYANPFLGDILALLAALFYALYVILLKVRIRSESRINMQLFFGFVGAFNIIALFPIGVVIHLTGIEPFHLPPTTKAWAAVILNMFITFFSDYIYIIAMLKTTPVVVTLGLCLTIPLAMIGDWILNIPLKAQGGLGALFVLASFGLISWENAGTPSPNNDTDETGRVSGTPQESRSIEVGLSG